MAVAMLSGCGTAGGSVVEQLPQLEVSFADTDWDGEVIPAGQQCSMFGGYGATPPLIVDNIPVRANAIIVEFNDRDYGPLSRDGGHGKVGFWIAGPKAFLPAVPGETADVLEGTFIEADGRARGRYAKPGYLPPCSGGLGKRYFAVVKAVYLVTPDVEEPELLATGEIDLGIY